METLYEMGNPEAFFRQYFSGPEWAHNTLIAPPHDPGEDGARVLAALRQSAVLHVMGKAGTGKTNLIKWLVGQLAGEKNVAVVAPTGTAALQAGGSTIHGLFRFPSRIITPSDILRSPPGGVLSGLDVIIVDECSMVRADLLDAMEHTLRHQTRNSLPFGGVQLVLVGDPFQLPPVVRTEDKKMLSTMQYRGHHFFQAKSLEEAPLEICELLTSHRHADSNYVELLDCIRLRRNIPGTLRAINARVGQQGVYGPSLVTLVTRHRVADCINSWEMGQLPGKAVRFWGMASGSFRKRDEPLPVPLILDLKPKARVMLVRNGLGGRWANGTLATVEDLGDDRIVVRLETEHPGAVHEILRERWDDYTYKYDSFLGQVVPKLVGRYEQFPLIPAWAVTIHKAQGATLDRVKIDLDGGAFAPGQVYVALSRARALDQVELVTPLSETEIIQDPAVVAFWRHIKTAA